ncbi:MAG: TlpA disulfide reductase family protein, partial [Chitinophaga rupis]
MKFFHFFLITLLPFSLLAQDHSFTLSGRLNDIDAQHVTLIYWHNGKQIKDTAAVTGHTYAFNGTTNGGSTAILKVGLPGDAADSNNLLLFYLDGGSLQITHKGRFSEAAFEGSPAQTEYLKLRAAGRAFFTETERLKKEQQLARVRHQDDEAKKLGNRLDSLQASKAEQLYGNYMRNNPGSPLMVFAFNKYYAATRGNTDPDKIMALVPLLPDSIKELGSYKAFIQQITNGKTYNTVVTIGKPAPDFTMDDTLGRPVALSSFLGHYVLLDFWASWCGPCRAENPNVVKEYAKYHDKGFNILSVSLDQPGKKDSWLKAIHDDKLTWNHVSDLKFWNSSVVKLYGVQGIPLNFLIDPQGKIVGRNLR